MSCKEDLSYIYVNLFKYFLRLQCCLLPDQKRGTGVHIQGCCIDIYDIFEALLAELLSLELSLVPFLFLYLFMGSVAFIIPSIIWRCLHFNHSFILLSPSSMFSFERHIKLGLKFSPPMILFFYFESSSDMLPSAKVWMEVVVDPSYVIKQFFLYRARGFQQFYPPIVGEGKGEGPLLISWC